MIIVTGATGALNGGTVDHLLERLPAAEIAVVARDRGRAQRLADRGLEVRYGDYADPGSLPSAFRGADQLLLVSSNDPHASNDAAVALHGKAIDAAREVEVGRVLYTSHQGAAVGSPFAPADVHARTEALLADSGLAWTSLRNGFYAHSLAWLAGRWRETGAITVPGDGPVSWTAREDEAEATAVILTADRPFDGPVTLTANAAPTFRDVAAAASELVGRPIEYAPVDEGKWLAGADEPRADFLLGFYRAAAQGGFAGVDPLLGELLGREPRPWTDALRAGA